MSNFKFNKLLLAGASCFIWAGQVVVNVASAQDFDVFYKPSNFKRICHADSLVYDAQKNLLTVNGFTGVDKCSDMDATKAAALDKLVGASSGTLVAAPFSLRLLDWQPNPDARGYLTGTATSNVQVVLDDIAPTPSPTPTPTPTPTPSPTSGFVNTTCNTPDNGSPIFQCDKNVIIAEQNQFNDTHLPGCAGQATTDPNLCRYSGSITSETYALRLNFKGFSDEFNKSSNPYRPVNLSTIDDMPGIDPKYRLFMMAISEKPGDFVDYLPSSNCSHTDAAGSVTIDIAQNTASKKDGYCVLTAGKTYYINVRPLNNSCQPPVSDPKFPNDPTIRCRTDINVNLPVTTYTTFTAPKSRNVVVAKRKK